MEGKFTEVRRDGVLRSSPQEEVATWQMRSYLFGLYTFRTRERLWKGVRLDEEAHHFVDRGAHDGAEHVLRCRSGVRRPELYGAAYRPTRGVPRERQARTVQLRGPRRRIEAG